MTEVGFCLGSNLGDRLALLQTARDRLAATPGARLLAQSSVYETDPVGVRPQYAHLKYLNAVVILDADLDAAEWLRRAQTIEAELGRVRSEDRYAPRTMDIDLLYRGADVIDDGGLTVPPRWWQRRFVLRPLCDVRPELRLPGIPFSVQEQWARLPPQGGENVRLYAAHW